MPQYSNNPNNANDMIDIQLTNISSKGATYVGNSRFSPEKFQQI